MSGIRIASIDEIAEMEGHLQAFRGEFSSECRTLSQSIRDSLTDIENRVDQESAEYRSARDYFSGIEEPGWEDEAALEEAEARFQQWSGYLRQFEEFADVALARVAEIETEQTRDVAAATKFIDLAVETARAYSAIHFDGANGTKASGGSSAGSASTVASRRAAPQGSAITSGRVADLPALPNGMSWVPIEALDWKEVDDDLEFKKAGEADISAMLTVFEREVLPLLARDPPADWFELSEMDRRDGRTAPTTGRAFAYEFMIGQNRQSDVVAVDAPRASQDEHYGWESGRHRTLIARRLGWKFMPARVLGGTR